MRQRRLSESARIPEAADGAKKAQLARSKKYGIGVKGGGNLAKPAEFADVPDEKFADPVNYRYPLAPPARATNAITRYNDAANQAAGGYTDGEWTTVGQRICQANPGKMLKAKAIVDEKPMKEAVKAADGSRSYDQISSEVGDAFRQAFPAAYTPAGGMVEDRWCREVFPDHVVARMGPETYAITYTRGAQGQIAFETDANKWTKVEQRYIPVSESLQLIEAKDSAETADADKGKEWEVVIIGPETAADVITEGKQVYIRSKNGRLYSAAALRASTKLWEGVKVYDSHLTDAEFEAKQGMRSVATEWMGVIVKPHWDEAAKALKGTLKVIDEALRKKLHEAWKAGVLDAIGLSIDALGDGSERPIKALGGEKFLVVERIDRALSVDVVAEPAAGGRLARLIASQAPITREEGKNMDLEALKTALAEAIAAGNLALIESLKAELATASAKLKEGEGDPPAGDPPAPAPAGDDPVAKANAILAQAQGLVDQAKAERELAESEKLVESKLAASGLTAAQRELIADQFKGRKAEAAELDAAIEKHRKVLTEATTTGGIRLPEGHEILASPLTVADNLELAFLELLAGRTRFNEIVGKAANKDGDPHFAPGRFSEAIGHYVEAKRPPMHHAVRLSEWYYDLMGGVDAAIDGRFANKRLKEAAITTSTVTSIVKNALNLMIAADYSVRERWWEQLVRQEDVDTLDTATLIRLYGMGGLNVMSEGDPYLELAWADDEEPAAFVKRGGYVGVTLETLLRDKINVLRSIPSRMANAWYNEISGLVSAVFTVNSAAGPVMGDSGALFNATAVSSAGGHANLLTTALSQTAFIAARLAMRKQTDQLLGAGKRLNIAPKFLLVPADLEQTAEEIRTSELTPGQSAATSGMQLQTKNILQGTFTTVVVPEFTDGTDWALVGDPAEHPAIWLVWLRGRRTPELFSAEQEENGAMFTNDEMRYKVRMFSARVSSSYDCAPVGDFRPLHKSNV